ncbi:MAG TPA: peptidylprolyl isomerase [Acidobacteriota bacterium]|nr:peptidylprolyl isomerase [Acidobacteriota bacterium]
MRLSLRKKLVLHKFGPWMTGFSVVSLLFVSLAAQSVQNESAATGSAAADASRVADPSQFPEVVAAVNDAKISRKELISRMESVRAQIHLPEGALPLSIYRSVLDELISIELLFQAAVAAGFEASDAEVEADLAYLRSRFPSPEAFEQELAAESLTLDELKAILKKDLSVQKFVEDRLAPAVTVSDAEVKAFFDEHQGEFHQPEQVRLRHILLRVDQGASDEQKAIIRRRLDDLRRQILEQQADFGTLAQEYSQDPGSKDQGGEMVIARDQTVEPFETAAFSTPVGGVSDIVETQYGYHLLKVEEKTEAKDIPFEEIAPRIREFLKRDRVRAQVELEVDRLRSSAAIQVFI